MHTSTCNQGRFSAWAHPGTSRGPHGFRGPRLMKKNFNLKNLNVGMFHSYTNTQVALGYYKVFLEGSKKG